MAAAFDFTDFLEKTSDVWEKHALKERYHIQNTFNLDKDVVRLGLKVIDWGSYNVDECIKNLKQGQENVESRFKSAAVAKDLRLKGNKLYQKNDFKAALDYYTKSIQTAPIDGSPTLPLGYANRSAALFNLGHYLVCMQDVNTAVYYGYPNDKHCKVFQRKAQCYLNLRFFREAKQEFLGLIGVLKMWREKKKRKKLKDLMRQCINPSYRNLKEQVDPVMFFPYAHPTEEISEKSSTLPSASSAITCKHQQGKGRYLEATRNIAPGELLIKERPYAAIVLKEEESLRCHYCTLFCAPQPCPHCDHARYCNVGCISDSLNRYHFLECGIEEFLQQVSLFSRLSLRILTTAGRTVISNHISNSKASSQPPSSSATPSNSSPSSSSSPSSTRRKASASNYKSIVDLEAHWFNHTHKELVQYTVTSILLAKCFYEDLVLPETLQSLSEDEIVTEIASLLLLHTRQLKSNSHAITQTRKSTSKISAGRIVEDVSQVRIATAVYPTASMMNHSCQPNVIASFSEGTISIRATESIKRGCEILHCYGPQAGHMTTMERQQALLNQYCFTCRCRACTNSKRNKDPVMHVRCMDCGDPINIQKLECVKCGDWFDKELLMKKVDKVLNKMRAFIALFPAGQEDADLLKDLVKKMRLCTEDAEHIIILPDMQVATAYDFLSKCYVTLGDYKEAGLWLAKSIPIVEWRYGRDSIEVANELFKLAQVHFNGRDIEAAIPAIDRALELFTRYYGHNDEVMELVKMKTCLMSL